MSELKANLYAALAKAQQRARAVEKDRKMTFGQQYKYASGESVIEEARHALEGNGLAFLATDYRVELRGEMLMLFARYLLTHESGEGLTLNSETPILPGNGRPEDKATATAKTYDLSYVLRALLLLPRVEDGAEVDARDDSKHKVKRKRTEASEIQAEAAQSSGESKTHKRKVWERLCALKEDLGRGEFARIVDCASHEVEGWKPGSEGEAHTKLARLEAALAARIAKERQEGPS